MKKRVSFIIATILIVSAVLAAGAVYFDKMAVMILSRSFDVDISYDRLWRVHFSEFLFDELKIHPRRERFGILAASADITPSFTKNFPRSIACEFLFKDIGITGIEDKLEKYDTLDGLMRLPFSGQWFYPDVKAKVEFFIDRAVVESFTAATDDIRVSFAGEAYYNKKVRGEIKISFAGDILKQIPDELSNIVMSDEGDGWRGISVKLDGDYSAPSVQLSSKLFKLTIRNIGSK